MCPCFFSRKLVLHLMQIFICIQYLCLAKKVGQRGNCKETRNEPSATSLGEVCIVVCNCKEARANYQQSSKYMFSSHYYALMSLDRLSHTNNGPSDCSTVGVR